MQFVYQSLTWGFLLVLLPVLIHLINLVRRRRIKWAAMEFLLQSHRRHRKWIWLRQLLLLLLRMAVVALAVAMVAQWISRSQWMALLGTTATHHYILLDDSFSMGERTGGTRAFDRAGRALARIVARLREEETPQRLTLIRFSRAARAASPDEAAAHLGQLADFNAALVDANFDEQLEQRRRAMDISQLAVGPRPALQLAQQLLDAASDETNVFYVVSDFRKAQWNDPTELRDLLRRIQPRCRAVHLVRCAPQTSGNLAITDLRPADQTRAAGVPLTMRVTVANGNPQAARRVAVQVRTTQYDRQLEGASEPGTVSGRTEEPPAVLIDEIPPGGSATAQVSVYFAQPGAHVVEAALPDDPLDVDNRRWYAADVPAAEPVLIIDPTPQRQSAYYLDAAFRPSQRARSGVQPEVQLPSYLRDATPEMLEPYRAVFLLDVDYLDQRAIENIEAFVRRGGGVAVFVGPEANLAHYTQAWYRNGEGFLPLPVERVDTLPEELLDNVPDFRVQNHPVFEVFAGERNPFTQLITIERYVRAPASWSAETGSAISVVATLRNQQPLVVERPFGKGRVVVFLTSLAPVWNNWTRNPTFVVTMLKLQSYLAAPLRYHPVHLTGEILTVEVDRETGRHPAVFALPARQDEERSLVQRPFPLAPEDQPTVSVSLGRDALGMADGMTDRSGIYEAWLTNVDGSYVVRRYAVNVDPRESDLALVSPRELRTRLAPVTVTVHEADEYIERSDDLPGYNRALILMILLIAFLLLEQIVAYQASYHPRTATAVDGKSVARTG